MTEPHIRPLAPEALDPQLRHDLAHAQGCRALSNTVLPRIWARRPELAQAQLALHTRFYDSNIVSTRLLELVRLTIAAINDCEVCRVARKSDAVSESDVECLTTDRDRFDPAERSAMDFAELLAADHLSIDRETIDRMRRHYTDAEVTEIAMFAALMIGSGRLAYALRAYPAATDQEIPIASEPY
jgi:alkylhydroperoxidase family enzyme